MSRQTPSVIWVLVTPLFVGGCTWLTGAREHDDAGGSRIDAGVDAAGVEDASFSDSALPTDTVSINEIRASGDDWVELYNATSTTIDLSGLRLADRASGGGPKIDQAITFPAATTVAAGGFLVIVTDLAAPRAGLQLDCLGGAVPSCFEAPWGISKDAGDGIFIVDAEGNVLVEADYPPSATLDGQTWARVPDGTGAFVAAQPTPGAVNVAVP